MFRWIVVIAGLAAPSLTGCSSGDEARCLEGVAPAEICVAGPNGSLWFDVSGLEPGSQFAYGTELAGEGTAVVAENGEPEGRIGFLGDFSGQTISISATSASGELIQGEVAIDG